MTLESANQVVDLLTAQVSENANVIMGARQDAGFGDTIKVMAIITGVGGTTLNTARMEPDALGRPSSEPHAAGGRPNNLDFALTDWPASTRQRRLRGSRFVDLPCVASRCVVPRACCSFPCKQVM